MPVTKLKYADGTYVDASLLVITVKIEGDARDNYANQAKPSINPYGSILTQPFLVMQ